MTEILKYCIDLFKMFSRWILAIFNVQVHSERGTILCKLFVILNLKTYLIFISEAVVPFVSLLTDKLLKGLS